MTQSEIQRAVDRLGEDLGRSVVINDPAIRMLHTSQHYGDEDEVRIRAVLHRDAGSQAIGHVLSQGVSAWTKPGPIPANPDIGMSARYCFPIRWRGELLGLLMVMDADGTLTTPDMDLAQSVVNEVSALLSGVRASSDASVAAKEAVVARLVSTDPRKRAEAMDELAALRVLPVEGHARAVTLEVRDASVSTDPEHVTIALRHALSAARPGSRGSSLRTVSDLTGTVVHFTPVAVPEHAATAHAREMVAQVHEIAAGRFTCVAGIGEPAQGVENAWSSARQSSIACRGTALVGDDGVASWGELGVYATLLRIDAAELDTTVVPRGLRDLAQVDRNGRLLQTLEAYLASGCSGPDASNALFIHRTTLYYRLDRIREITGADLDDGEVRLSLHLGLKMLRLLDGDLRQ